MKYIITAKNNFNGANDHITNPLERTEICTEMIFTRLKAIELLNTGVIDSSDCIVTRIDRRCLYDNLFENVIDYQDFFKGYLRVFGKESPNTWAFMQGMNLPFFEKEMSNSLLAIK